MVAPVTNHKSAGHAALEVELVCRESAVTSACATSPMKLLAPRSRGQSVWAYTSSFGGGLVAGDETRLNVTLGENTHCFLGTQASTKVYRNPAAQPCGHETRATLGPGAALIFAPDPVQAFAGSTYRQKQTFNLAPDASLALVDWMSSGRAACGERWAFNHFQSRNEVWRAETPPAERGSVTLSSSEQEDALRLTEPRSGEKLIFLDSLTLDPADGDLAAQHRTGRFNCFAMLLLLGPKLRDVAQTLLAETAAAPVSRQSPLVFSASPIADGAVLRIAGEHVETVGRELHKHLAPLSDLLGDDPWARKF